MLSFLDIIPRRPMAYPDINSINADTWVLWTLVYFLAFGLLAGLWWTFWVAIPAFIKKTKAFLRSVRANFPPP